MKQDQQELARQLAAIEDDLATAHAALEDEEYETLQHLDFRESFRWCLNTHPTFTRDEDVHTVVGRTHLLMAEYIPDKNDTAIKSCLREFEQIVDELRQWNTPVLQNA